MQEIIRRAVMHRDDRTGGHASRVRQSSASMIAQWGRA